MIFSKSVKRENYFLSQPHQPFFLLGIINAVVFMSLFALAYRSLVDITISVTFLHVYSLMFLVFSNFFTGFLFTTFPRFNQAQIVHKSYYLKIFFANVIFEFLFLVGIFSSINLVKIGLFALLVSHLFVVGKLYLIFKNGKSINKKDSFWILIANFFGLLGEALFLLYLFGILDLRFAINISFYMYLIFLTFSVAQRMIPFFSHSLEPKDPRFVGMIFTLFIFKTIASFYDTLGYVKIFEAILDLCIGIYMLREFLRWKLPSFNSPAILWVLHLGLFWLPVAFLISGLTLLVESVWGINFYFMGIHFLSLGFLSTVFVGFGTRVILGHSGQPPHTDSFAKNIFLFVQVVLLLRVLYSVSIAFDLKLEPLFDISVTAWLILFIVWGLRYGKMLVYKKNI